MVIFMMKYNTDVNTMKQKQYDIKSDTYQSTRTKSFKDPQFS